MSDSKKSKKIMAKKPEVDIVAIEQITAENV